MVPAVRGDTSMASYFRDVISDWKIMQKSVKDISIMFIKRVANMAAHAIARAFFSVVDRVIRSSDFSPKILDVIIMKDIW